MTRQPRKVSPTPFGLLLRALRGPDTRRYRYLIAEQHWLEITKDRQYDLLRFDSRRREAGIRRYTKLLPLPHAFREYHRRAKQLKIEMKSLRDMAQLLGISKNTLHDYETGKRYPPAEFVYAFCAAIDFPAETLMDQWVRFHPNEMVRKSGKSSHDKPASLVYMDGKYFFNPFDINVIHFFVAAIDLAAHRAGANKIWGDQTLEVANYAARILHKTLSAGLELDPHNIDVNADYDNGYPDVFYDEDGFIDIDMEE